MSQLNLHPLATSSQQMPTPSGAPKDMEPYIANWKRRTHGALFEGLATPRDADAWISLGDRIIRALLASSGYIVVCATGQCGSVPMLEWTRAFVNENGLGSMTTRIQIVPHYATTRFNLLELFWSCLSESKSSAWTSQLWSTTESNLFHVGCSLIVAGFADVPKHARKAGSLQTLKDFGRALEEAWAWVTPLDGNIGFIVGLAQGVQI
jgi:hypothetical protein